MAQILSQTRQVEIYKTTKKYILFGTDVIINLITVLLL